MGNPDGKENKSPTRVYVDMVADLFHYGHVEFLRQVSCMGDYILVGINHDDVAEIYKRRPINTMEQRIASVRACKYVNEVIPSAPWFFDPTWIEKYNLSLVVHGDDYSDQKQRDMYKIPIERGIFRTVPYTKGISTTELIRRSHLTNKLAPSVEERPAGRTTKGRIELIAPRLSV
ncbi:MAG: adenylyltransferase/cytidyltransferase family protein [Aestuariibacter sp.]|nr:adenylyltransferase/cytidyltransferase family protein [Aestuariibacter sp.]